MKKMTSPSSEVRQLCQQINKEVDRERLQDLVGRLQQALREEQNKMECESTDEASRQDNPFDKVLLC
jgi:hypothetical protein